MIIIIDVEVGPIMPDLPKIVIKRCSFILKGPGFIENAHLVPGTLIGLAGRVAAINFPNGRMRIWIHSEVILTWF